jgi:Ca2+-binding RTX toxin-like protein
VTRSARHLALAAACLAGWLALPATAAGHQKATLGDGVLTIIGDYASPAGEPKPNDLVTLEVAGGDLVVGNDVFGPHPTQCAPSAENPQRVILCPLSLISSVQIDTGIGSDSVVALGLPVPITAALGSGNDSFQGGSEFDTVSGGSGSDKAFLGAGRDTASMGSGTDKAYGGAGRDILKGGGASDQLFGGGGNDECRPGPGSGKEISC